MRILLDTNILIHREASTVVREEIGVLFNWLDRLNYEKCVHPLSVSELSKHADKKLVRTMSIKLRAYTELKTQAPDSQEIQRMREKYDASPNDSIDTAILNELFCQRVQFLVTEDRKIHRKARELGIADQVFTIDDLLEKFVSENPDLVDYKVLAVKKEYFGNVDLADPFFDSFKEDYEGFTRWFHGKSDEVAYVCRGAEGKLLAFLYLKKEAETENYGNIKPPFEPKKRLKVGTFKVILNGFKLGRKIFEDNL